MLRKLLKSERGAISIMLLGTFLTILLIFFMVMATLAVGVFKHVYYTYGAAGDALKWAVYSANMDGKLSAQTQITADEVEPYFQYSFQKITGSSWTGDVPGTCTGGNFQAPVQVTALYEVPAGTVLPSGTVTNQPGFVVSLEVPVFTNPILGLSSLTVTVTRFAVSQPMPVFN